MVTNEVRHLVQISVIFIPFFEKFYTLMYYKSINYKTVGATLKNTRLFKRIDLVSH